jgi:hypothetical protein
MPLICGTVSGRAIRMWRLLGDRLALTGSPVRPVLEGLLPAEHGGGPQEAHVRESSVARIQSRPMGPDGASMNPLASIARLMISSTLLFGVAGSGVRAPDRIATAHAGSHAPRPAALPPFTLFGWVSLPIESTTDARIAEMASAGINVMLPALDDSGRLESNLRRLDLAAAHGQRCLVWDERFSMFFTWSPTSP